MLAMTGGWPGTGWVQAGAEDAKRTTPKVVSGAGLSLDPSSLDSHWSGVPLKFQRVAGILVHMLGADGEVSATTGLLTNWSP